MTAEKAQKAIERLIAKLGQSDKVSNIFVHDKYQVIDIGDRGQVWIDDILYSYHEWVHTPATHDQPADSELSDAKVITMELSEVLAAIASDIATSAVNDALWFVENPDFS